MMARYRKKPIVVEATKARIRHGVEASVMLPMCVIRRLFRRGWWIRTLEGWHRVTEGDFIITGVAGEVYPCKPDIFEATYEPAETE